MGYPSRYVEFFGPAMWKTLHAVSFTYPENPTPEQRMQYIDFFRAVGPVIPCPSCSTHYIKYMDENPIEADNTESLAKWVYDLHKDVNKRQNKTSPTFEEVKDDYAGWNDQKHKAMQRLPTATKLKMLADPHLGRSPVSKTESSEGNSTGLSLFSAAGPNKILILFVVALAAYMIFRRRPKKQSDEK